MEEVIKIRNLSKNYHTDAGEVNVLKGVDITIEKGEFVAIMGPSGSGKSTFMNILGCLDKVTSGNYFLGGKDTNALSRDELAELRNHMIGFVFQGFNLIPRQNLIDNVALPLVYAGMKAHDRKIRAKEILKSVGLEAFGTYLPNQISGGQQQRVAIARALVNRPKLILADEPTGNLDTKTSEEIMQLFCDLNEKEGITIVLVTHEPDIAGFAKRLVNFVDGKIQHDGPTALHVKENA
jgi:putative ABC transport system ATP-binding protein